MDSNGVSPADCHRHRRLYPHFLGVEPLLGMQETSDAACCPGSPVCGNVLPGDGRAPDLRLARRARLH